MTSMGSGAFALVLKAATTREEHVAVKIMSRRNFNARGIGKQLDREVHLLKNLEHPNIVGLLDSWESGDAVFVVLELCELGDLSQILAREIKLNESTTAHYMKQLLEALACVHQFPAVHRDVKPDNLLITSRYELKLTDFGWAAELEPDLERRRTLSGTFVYMAPEVLSGDDQDERVDSWSAGAVMYEMLTGRPLLQTFIGAGATGLSAQDPFRSTAERQRRLLAEIGALNLARILLQLNLSPECDQLLRGLLSAQKDRRLRCEDAQFEPFVGRVQRRTSSTAERRGVVSTRVPTAVHAQEAKHEPVSTLLSTRSTCTPREVSETDENVPTPERPSRGERNAYTPPLSNSPEKKMCDEDVVHSSGTTTASSSPHLQPSLASNTSLNTSILWRDASAHSEFATMASADSVDVDPTEPYLLRSIAARPRYCPSPTVPPRASPPAPEPRACGGAYRSVSDRLSCTMIPRHQEVSFVDPLSYSVKTQSELNYSVQRTHNLSRAVQHSSHLDQLQRTMPSMPLRKAARAVAVPSSLDPAQRVSPAAPTTLVHTRRSAVGTTDGMRRSMLFVPPPRSVIYR
jgi:serine/threonine protein kinase